MNKAKIIWGVIVAVAVVFAGYLWFHSYKAKTKPASNPVTSSFENTMNADTSDDTTTDAESADEQEMQDFNANCEAGQWQKISDAAGETTVSGKLRRVYPDDEASKQFSGYSYFLEGAEKIALAGADLGKLDYFEDREVEVQGVRNAAKNELAVSQIRCAGAESDKTVLDQRKKLMSYLTDNINSIAPKKAKYQKWIIDEADFVDGNNVYAMYYDTAENDDNSDVSEDTERKILLEVKPQGAGFEAKVNAYFEMGEDDFVLKSGTDKYADSDTSDYQYDPDAKTWERID